jgi:hypothetical protein
MKKIKQGKDANVRADKRSLYETYRRKEWERYKASKDLPGKGRVKRGPGADRHDFSRMPAPENFSLTENPDEVIGYFNEAAKIIDEGGRIKFDFSGVINVTSDAIAFFIAHFNDNSFCKGRMMKATLPKCDVMRRRFNKSGILDHVSSDIREERGGNNFLLHKVTKNKVENGIAKDMAKKGSEFVFGANARIRAVYEILIECMANTNNHAAGSEVGVVYDWWLVMNSSEVSRKVNYTILDLGVGVFESSPMKLYVSSLVGDIARRFRHNADLVDDLVLGKIRSSTGLDQRGKGIPLIHKRSQDTRIINSVMVSNDVMLDLCSGKAKRLSSEFSGTLIHFELSSEMGD